ncbi:hypothetical protein N7466_009438 [Penicillium verhagenii]|uniref:uncharacterized protein n=1 Tax=Penicillium verhagenii TaxID=1562060 RepID=UPI0025455F6C|nr:uncharacterized protein N7466_009438 [Penicillium verhagenii]KAJ5921112.1 hypothetical protein N7466_009438 [Penicillium verhagenii]
MGFLKLILKVVIIPLVVVVVIVLVIGILLKMRHNRKKEEKQAKQRGFHPPPITQWVYPENTHDFALNQELQKPAPVVYPLAAPSYVATPDQVELGYARA